MRSRQARRSIKVVNMSPTAGAVDVFITAANADLAAATPVARTSGARAVFAGVLSGAGHVSDSDGAGGNGGGGTCGGGEDEPNGGCGGGRQWPNDRDCGCGDWWGAAQVVRADGSVVPPAQLGDACRLT